MRKGKTLYMKKTIIYILTLVGLFLAIFPIVWLFMGSFKTQLDLFTYPPLFIFHPTLKGFKLLFTTIHFQRYLGNTIFFASTSVAVALPCAAFLAYALAFGKGKAGKLLNLWVFAIFVIPPIVFVLPYYLIFSRLGLLNTRFPLFIVYTAFHIPFMAWLLRGFFQELGPELIEAAMIDGCTLGRAFVKVVLPLSLPGLSVVAILTLIGAWNDFLFATVLTVVATKTAPVFIAALMGPTSVQWNAILGSMSLTIIPLLILALVIQKYIIRGLTLGAIKG